MLPVLIETRLNSMKLNESAKPRKGCLGRIEGICADFKNPTRNGRFYSKKLWENVFKDPIFEESLKSKTLLGELDHPEDRLEVLAGEACIVMTDYTIDEKEGVIYAGFDILDTPRGKILKSLLDYGCVMGVSSRGQGDITNTSEGECVDEDTYDFACFDVVTTPAVAKARQNVVESVKKTKTFIESIKTQITEAETVGDLKAIRKVLESTQTPEMDSLIESIETKCNSITEGKTITSNTDELHVVNEDLNSNATINNTDDAHNTSAKTIRGIKGLNRDLVKCVNSLRKQISALEHREKRLVSVVESKESTITTLKKDLNELEQSKKTSTYVNSKLKGQINNLDERLHKVSKVSEKELSNAQNTINGLEKDLQVLESRLNHSQKDLQGLKESNKSKANTISQLKESVANKSNEVSKLKEDYQRIKKDCTKSQADCQRLSDDYQKAKSEYQKINSDYRKVNEDYRKVSENYNNAKIELQKNQEQINTNNKLIESLKKQVKQLTEQLSDLERENIQTVKESTENANAMEDEINTYSDLIESLQDQIKNLKQEREDKVSSLNTVSNKNKHLSEQLESFRNNYVQLKCRQFGLDVSTVTPHINSDSSIKQVNSILESLQKTKDRYAKLPITESAPTGVRIQSSNIVSADEESEKLFAFIEGVQNAR